MPTEEIDIYRTAWLLVRRYGEEAPKFAYERSQALLAERDEEGEKVWLRILRAVRDLLIGPQPPSIH